MSHIIFREHTLFLSKVACYNSEYFIIISDGAAYHVFLCALFPVQGGPHTSLHWKQRTYKYMICCHIAHNNAIFIILTRDFSKKQCVLPEDVYAISYRNM